MKPLPDLTARQVRALDQLGQLAPAASLTDRQLAARVWNLDWDELEWLLEAGLVCRRQERVGMLYWLSARGRRYVSERHEEEIAAAAAG